MLVATFHGFLMDMPAVLPNLETNLKAHPSKSTHSKH